MARRVSPTLHVSAPGKLMIVGEYAVLSGCPAVVAAVDARVRMWATHSAPDDPLLASDLPPEALAAKRAAEAAYGPIGAALSLDTSRLRAGGQKLGLGSSAAAAAAAAGLVLAAAGRDLTSPAVRAEVLDFALRGHRAVAPRGSGADVAACTLGGFVHFVRQSRESVKTSALAWPDRLAVRVVWTGKQVRTSTMLDAVEDLRRRDPKRLEGLLSELSVDAEVFIRALSEDDVSAVLRAAASYGDTMGRLGRAAGAPIVEDTLRRIVELAQHHGGAAKPSGAGGGDVALALFTDRDSAGQFEDACVSHGFRVLHLRLGVEGVCVDP